jgi:TrmH family RNA methyltransferase
VSPSVITSRSNPLIRDLRALLRAPGRASGRCAAEGWRLLEAAVDAGASMEILVLTADAAEDPRWERLRKRLQPAGARHILVAPDVLGALTQVPSPQGVLAVVKRPRPASPLVIHEPRALLAVLDGIQDPGNVGTILRTAAAVGATAGITVGATADPLGPKALRASAGAVFRLPLLHYASPHDAAVALAHAGVHMLVADPRGNLQDSQASFARPLALVFGSEAAGADPAWRRVGAQTVRLPIAGSVESLNVAAAAAVLLYRATQVD